MVSGILFTGNNFVINQSSVSVSDVVLVRTVLQLLVYSLIIWARSERILPTSPMQQLYTLLQGLLFFFSPTFLNCSSGLTGAVAFICSLACVSFMAVPDALCIIFACPVVTILLSAVMLRDKLNLVKIIAGALLLLGVILVCKPPFLFSDLLVPRDRLYYLGVLLASTACMAAGLMDVLVAKCSEVSTPVLVLWTAVIGLVISLIYCLTTPSSHILSPAISSLSWYTWATYTGLAVSGLLAFTTLTKSLQLISPNMVASLRSLELVLAFLVQSLLTGTSPEPLSCLGGGLILCGVLLLAFQDHIIRANRRLGEYVKEQVRQKRSGEMERTRLLL